MPWSTSALAGRAPVAEVLPPPDLMRALKLMLSAQIPRDWLWTTSTYLAVQALRFLGRRSDEEVLILRDEAESSTRRSRLKPAPAPWEAASAVALAKLIDIVRNRPAAQRSIAARCSIENSMAEATAALMAASASFALAVQRSQDELTRRAEQERARELVSEVARRRGRLRWKARDTARLRALQLAQTIDVPHRGYSLCRRER